MKNLNNRLLSICILCFTVLIVSCQDKMDDYKKYIEGDPVISYTGKLDSVKVFSGHNRVLVEGLMKSDPKIVEARVYWNNRRDSISVPVNRTNSVDTLRAYINNLPEGVYNFEFVTFDNIGNRSVRVFQTGRSYGANYVLSLINRPAIGATTQINGSTVVTFSGLSAESGAMSTDIKYIDKSNVEKTVTLPITGSTITLPSDYKEGTALDYRTKYRPDTTAIDVFYTDYKKLNVRRYVTNQYLVNYAAPFATSACSGSRWCTPSGWITNSAVRNFTTGGVSYGGVDGNQNHRLGMEAGWSTTLISFTNGKIYQTVNLPAGDYDFELNLNGAGTTGVFYLVAALGTEIPNIENFATGALSYLSFVGKTGTQTISFRLTEPKTVSLGFVGSLTGSGSAGQYWKAESVALKQLIID